MSEFKPRIAWESGDWRIVKLGKSVAHNDAEELETIDGPNQLVLEHQKHDALNHECWVTVEIHGELFHDFVATVAQNLLEDRCKRALDLLVLSESQRTTKDLAELSETLRSTIRAGVQNPPEAPTTTSAQGKDGWLDSLEKIATKQYLERSRDYRNTALLEYLTVVNKFLERCCSEIPPGLFDLNAALGHACQMQREAIVIAKINLETDPKV